MNNATQLQRLQDLLKTLEINFQMTYGHSMNGMDFCFSNGRVQVCFENCETLDVFKAIKTHWKDESLFDIFGLLGMLLLDEIVEGKK